MSAFFVHTGLLATPFFGSGAFLWANVLACYLLALAAGFGLGDLLIAIAAGRIDTKRLAPRLAVAGGVLAWLACWASPEICRWILAGDPEWTFAPAVAIAITTIVPGTLIAAIAPSELRARVNEVAAEEQSASQVITDDSTVGLSHVDGRTGARVALRLLGLMTLGGITGIALSAKSVLRADEVEVWLFAYLCGAILVALGLSFLGTPGRVFGGVAIAALAALSVVRPSEVQSAQFAVALETAWKEGQGAGVYYRHTHDKTVLGEDALKAHAARVSRDEGEKAGVILACELLMNLGDVTVQGPNLCKVLDLLLPPDARPFIMPFFEQVDSIRSDGKGMLFVRIKRNRGEDGRHFAIPGERPGEKVEFWFSDDFTIHITRNEDQGVWKLEFGPITTVKAGIFDLNDNKQTPLRVPNVALFGAIEACLLGIVLEDYPDQVVVKALAQANIGAPRTIDVQAIAKERRQRR
jgi:hypothetical protein